jgi:dephospho-CoA kinase
MIKVGITGNIGAGKSLVSNLFESLNWPVFYSDIEAKNIMNTDEEVVQKIKDLVGFKAYTHEGKLNRHYISKIIFSDSNIREAMNEIIHPKVENNFQLWCNEKSHYAVLCKESALIFEKGLNLKLDVNILVVADFEERILRVMQRDRVDRQNVIDRINAQWDQERKIELADYIIDNNHKKYLIRNTLAVYRLIKKKFNV